MSTALLNIFVRVIKRRLSLGECLDDIIAGYVNLSEEEKEQIMEAVK